MKKYFFVIFFICYLFSCQIIKKEIEPLDFPVNQIFEYNPKKAGAEIVEKITFDKVDYLSYHNNKLYCISNNKILVCKINKNIQTENIIEPDLCALYNENSDDISYSINKCFGIFSDQDNIYIPAIIEKNQNNTSDVISTFYDVMSISCNFNIDGKIDSVKSKFPEIDITYNYSYDLSADLLFEIKYKKNQKLYFYQYYYSQTDFLFKKNDQYDGFFDINNSNTPLYYYEQNFISQNIYLSLYKLVHKSQFIDLFLNIISQNDFSLIHQIDLTYLNLKKIPLSAFSDSDGNIWLYVHEYDSETKQDKYELVKLKLLEQL